MRDFREPIFDDDQLALIEEQQTTQLVSDLVECIISLCNATVKLRAEVNELSHRLDPHAPPTYYEVYSDLCKSFEDSPAYSRFEQQLSRLIYE